ncbi:TonB-dependent receptor [hydrothermal vent metagenome]|uniref:TonB-dependent receptor n=1 Tax=hydrothermal vent metagenome TaxID=652676 RepID=A0A3B0REX0_9ZZZZ
MNKNNGLNHSVMITSLLVAGMSSAIADEKPHSEDHAGILESIMVIGSAENIEKMPGSAQFIGKEEIRQQSYDDVNRILRKVPGVYIREEDGFGLFPSVSMRGVDTSRSAKVTVMEDGVLMAPAPYSAPSAYYSPTMGRMSGLEVLKGSSQIKYGPHITGGVINYLSTPIPLEETYYLKSLIGSFGELRTHAYVGNTIDTAAGRFGFLIEGYGRKSDGFKRIDESADFRDGDDTGFGKFEPMVQLSWEPDSEIYQRLEFKYGRTDLDANETYLGLSEADFSTSPLRRYGASRFDNITTEQNRSHLRYLISPTENLDITTTLYFNSFKRNWYKLKDIRNVNGNKISLSSALAGLQNGEGLDCLKGDLACTLRVRANNREYKAKGVETVAQYHFGSAGVDHEITAGVRLHRDQVRRFQWDDDYIQAANGTISDRIAGIPGGAGDRLQKTGAVALFIQDTIESGAWTFTPGIRYEFLDQRYESPKGSLKGTNRMTLFAGGLGLSYGFNDALTAFGGIHRGFSPPSPKGAISGLTAEISTSLEAGLRYSSPDKSLSAETALFYTAFRDLIVIDNIGGAGTGDDENFGEAVAYGLEFSLQFDAGAANDWSLGNPWFINLTYTNAQQKNDALSTDAQSIFSFGRKGNRLPYIPSLQVAVGTGIESESWGAFISGNYVGASFSSASNVTGQLNGNGVPDARFGRIDSYFVADFSLYYRLGETVKLFGGVQNLLDGKYSVSRQPHGPRPGMPRFFYTGIEIAL